MRYVPQDQLDDARNAIACGVPVATLASQIGVSEDELRMLLRLPQWKREEPQLLLDITARTEDVL